MDHSQQQNQQHQQRTAMMITRRGRPYPIRRRCCASSSLWTARIPLLVVVLLGFIIFTSTTTTTAQIIVPPGDEASYSGQCSIAPTIALNEPVTVTFTNGSIVWVDPTNINSTQRHPQQGSVLLCDSSNTENYNIRTHKNQWYTIRGNGQVLTASTSCRVSAATVAASITVYQDQCPTLQCAADGSRGCPGLCIDTAMATSVESRMTSTTTRNNDDDDCGSGTSVSWVSQMNRTYYIQVWQHYDVLGGIRPMMDPLLEPCGGSTTLTVVSASAQSTVPTHYNSCFNAQSLSGNTTTTTSSIGVGNGTSYVIINECSPDNAVQPGIGGSGLWYTLLGNGKVWYIETCHGILLSLFTGPTCQQLSCYNDFVVENVVNNSTTTKDGGGPQCSRTTFYTTNATRYYIYASGPGILHSTFRLVAQETTITTAAIHNRCVNATRFVADGIPKSLSFDTAVHSELRPDQLFIDVTPTLWYQLNGTGNVFTVQVCPTVSPNLFTGSCTGGAIDRYDLIKPTSIDDTCMTFSFQSDVTLQYLFAFRNLDQGTKFNVTLWEENAQELPLYSTSCQYAMGPLWYNASSVTIGKFVDATVGAGAGTTTNLMKTIYFYANRPMPGKLLRGRVCRRTTTNSSSNFDIVLKVTALETCQYTMMSTSDAGTLVGPMDGNGCRSISWRRSSDSWNTAPLLIVVTATDVMDIDIAIWQESSSSTIVPLNDKPPESYWSDNNATKNYPGRISVGTKVIGSTVNAHADLPPYGSCNKVKDNQPDVWYIVQGDGRELEACVTLRGGINNSSNSNSSSSSFGGALAVVTELIDIDAIFTGCVPNVKYGTVTNCPISVRWKTTNDTIYSLLVQTTQPNAFELSLWNVSDFSTTDNNEWQCIAPPSPTNGSNSSRSSSSVAPEVVITSGGVASFRNCCGNYKWVALAAALVHGLLFIMIIA